MTLLAPLFLMALPLIGIPIALHLWAQAPAKHAPLGRDAISGQRRSSTTQAVEY